MGNFEKEEKKASAHQGKERKLVSNELAAVQPLTLGQCHSLVADNIDEFPACGATIQPFKPCPTLPQSLGPLRMASCRSRDSYQVNLPNIFPSWKQFHTFLVPSCCLRSLLSVRNLLPKSGSCVGTGVRRAIPNPGKQ